MKPPETIEPKSLADYLDVMSQAIFQAGISWSVVESKWPGIRTAFHDFDPETVAAYGPDDIERLMGDPAVIRNRKKIEAVVGNAGELIVVDRDFGGFRKYLGTFADNEALVKDLHKRFKFLGPSAAHFFLFVVGWDPDAQEAWATQNLGHGHAGS